MIPNTKLRVVESHGVTASGVFGISLENSAHIMTILRDTLYSDKVLAVLREYSSNAWDAHREIGKDRVPIKITLPTSLDPTLSIRDYGPGLSPDAVFEVYTQYGASTKRTNDKTVGMLGIGSKSGFAYADSFAITSWYDGMKRTYVAALDSSEKGIIQMLHEEECPVEETGVLIQIAVQSKDIAEFTSKAKELFRYFDPRPDINTDLPELPPAQKSLTNGVIYEKSYGDSGWVAVMGCVSYRINLNQLDGMEREPEGGVARFLHNLHGALYFNIGEVQINASREELKYSDETKAALVRRFNALVDEYVQVTLDSILNHGYTPWERRKKAQVLRELGLPVPRDCKDLLAGHVDIDEETMPSTFMIVSPYKKVKREHIGIREGTRLILKDDTRQLAGFQLDHDTDHLIYRVDRMAWDTVRSDLDAFVTDLNLQGIPIVQLSNLPWNVLKVGRSGKTNNPKHKGKTFVFKPSGGHWYHHPWSRHWDPVDRDPQPTDVFVLIDRFQVLEFDFFHTHMELERVATSLGGTIPTIYGYKNTEKSPMSVTDDLGVPYQTWKTEFLNSLLTQSTRDKLEQWEWMRALDIGFLHHSETYKKIRKTLHEHLGASHEIVQAIEKNQSARQHLQRDDDLVCALETYHRLMGKKTWKLEATDWLANIRKRYPLLVTQPGLACLWHDNAKDWAEYIHLIDNRTATP